MTEEIKMSRGSGASGSTGVEVQAAERPWTPGTYAVDLAVWMPGGAVADCYWVSGRITAEQARANATLYAAAPDLYEALHAILNTTAVSIPSIAMANRALAALSKARGDQ